MDVQTTNIFTRQMSRLRRVSLQTSEMQDGILTQTIGGFIDPNVQYRYVQQIMAIRALCPTLEEKKRNEQQVKYLKTSLPAGIVSAVVENGIGADNVILRNGVVCIDIDAQDNPAITDWQAFKQEIAKSRFIAYVGLSISGLGVFAMIPIADPTQHKQHYDAIVQDFKAAAFTFMQSGETEPTTLMGVNLDPKTSNIASKRFVSYDPQPYINTEAQVYCKTYEPPKAAPRFSTPYNGSKTWSVREWLDRHGITYNVRTWNGGYKYIVTCPWHQLHSSCSKGESAVMEGPDGVPGYVCQHSHCADKHWHAYREFYEPRAGRTRIVNTPHELSSEQIAECKVLAQQASQRNKPTHPTTEEVIAPMKAKNPAVGSLVEAFDLEVVFSPEEVRKWQRQVELEGVPF